MSERVRVRESEREVLEVRDVLVEEKGSVLVEGYIEVSLLIDYFC